VVQGIVTGVGFLGAGVIMKEGLNISGLTTAASIWASSAIGITGGYRFFWRRYFAGALVRFAHDVGPQTGIAPAIASGAGGITGFYPGTTRMKNSVKQTIYGNGATCVAEGSLNISADKHTVTWTFVMVALRQQTAP
jgi:putative Mg2+ transporter-C (MgtC) family protein